MLPDRTRLTAGGRFPHAAIVPLSSVGAAMLVLLLGCDGTPGAPENTLHEVAPDGPGLPLDPSGANTGNPSGDGIDAETPRAGDENPGGDTSSPSARPARLDQDMVVLRRREVPLKGCCFEVFEHPSREAPHFVIVRSCGWLAIVSG